MAGDIRGQTDPQHNLVVSPSGSVVDLWQAYRVERQNKELRGELILRYAPLVKYVAGRLAIHLPPALSMEDLLGHGTVGLIEAVDRFDPRQGVKFETYAIGRIWGSMIDALRSMSMLPRGASRQLRGLDEALSSLEVELGRTPSTEELAGRLGLEEGAVLNLLVTANFALISLDTSVGNGDEGDSLTLLDILAGDEEDDPLRKVERSELTSLLAKAIDRLPERERMILSLYYHDDLTLKEIGKVLQVSES